MVDEHPAQEEIALIKQANDKLRKNLDKLKGKEKGLTHKEINNNFREMRHIETQLLNSILDDAEVICCTTIGAGHHVLGDRKFPIVIIDEATQASEPSALVPINRGCRQLILVGDHRQLPPTVISETAEIGGLGQSLLSDSTSVELVPRCSLPSIVCIQ